MTGRLIVFEKVQQHGRFRIGSELAFDLFDHPSLERLPLIVLVHKMRINIIDQNIGLAMRSGINTEIIESIDQDLSFMFKKITRSYKKNNIICYIDISSSGYKKQSTKI